VGEKDHFRVLKAIEGWDNCFDTSCIKERFSVRAKRTIDVHTDKNSFVVDVDIVES